MHVTLVSMVILSRGRQSFREETCLSAVRNAVALKRPVSHNGLGRAFNVAVQRRNNPTRSTRSANHDDRFFLEGQAYLSQEDVLYGSRPGTWQGAVISGYS